MREDLGIKIINYSLLSLLLIIAPLTMFFLIFSSALFVNSKYLSSFCFVIVELITNIIAISLKIVLYLENYGKIME